ncbi:MAG: sulfatase-like hydrolase/transferase [Verrucomicrobia bacterium]|nr:sulfatase-like hydrolase/transferase [Verrucomicrobiota bacterium]
MAAPDPDILLILTTQWRAAACGYAGDPNARTPCLDALAAASVNYAQAVTPHPFGPFARAALLTGVPSPGNGIRDYFDPLPAGARTLAHRFNERGYATAYFGKWHLGRRDPRAALVGPAHARTVIPPQERGGFSFWEGFEGGFLLNDPWLHGTRLPVPTQVVGYQSDVVCARAAEWLENSGYRNPESGADRPWLCVVSLEAPHPPYDAPAAGVTAGRPEDLVLPANVPRGGEAEVKARRELAGYYAHVEATDRAIGRLVAGVPAGTIVVVTSVHGDMHGAHGLFRKGWPHEESVRVPLLVRRPGVPPRRDDSAVSLLDLPALLWSPAWSPPPAARISMPSVVALPHQCDRVWRGVRTRTRKLVLNDDGSPWLLFDLASDPQETRNLADDPSRRAEIAELRALMD